MYKKYRTPRSLPLPTASVERYADWRQLIDRMQRRRDQSECIRVRCSDDLRLTSTFRFERSGYWPYYGVVYSICHKLSQQLIRLFTDLVVRSWQDSPQRLAAISVYNTTLASFFELSPLLPRSVLLCDKSTGIAEALADSKFEAIDIERVATLLAGLDASTELQFLYGVCLSRACWAIYRSELLVDDPAIPVSYGFAVKWDDSKRYIAVRDAIIIGDRFVPVRNIGHTPHVSPDTGASKIISAALDPVSDVSCAKSLLQSDVSFGRLRRWLGHCIGWSKFYHTIQKTRHDEDTIVWYKGLYDVLKSIGTSAYASVSDSMDLVSEAMRGLVDSR